MSRIMQESSIDGEKINRTGYASIEPDESPEQLSGSGTAGSPASPFRKTTDTILDQEYVRSMEERYGIREEGIL
ncbi:MAG: hypothetical protein V1766_05595 [Pseudomonadota bacterium]